MSGRSVGFIGNQQDLFSLNEQALHVMMTDPQRLGRTLSRVLHFRSKHAAGASVAHATMAYESHLNGAALCTMPLVLRHEDVFIARHQQSFLAAALRHDARAELLERRERTAPAARHRRMAILLRAYAQPGEIERLPIISRSGPKSDTVIGSVNPAMVAFLEGAAEEFFRIYGEDAGMRNGSGLIAAFKRANFHRIYIARLLEIDGFLREGRATSVAEATLMRRYGPHSL